MKLFDVSDSANGTKCGGCNWEVTKRYWMDETQEQANQQVSKMNPEDESPLCGDCMCGLLAEGGYTIVKNPQN